MLKSEPEDKCWFMHNFCQLGLQYYEAKFV